MRNSEYAIHRADRTADTGADRAAHHGADRTRRAAAFAGAFLRAADDALRMAEMGYGKQGQDKSRGGKLNFKGRVDRQRRCPDLHLHLNSSFDSTAVGAGSFNADAAEKLRDGDGFVVTSLAPPLRRRCAPLRKIDPDHPINPPSPCLRPAAS